MPEYIEREAVREYYVIRDKNTGLYFRGKGVNRWGKYYNQATIYRVKGTAEHTIKSIAWSGGEEAEVVQIQIVESTADVGEVKNGKWEAYGLRNPQCSLCRGYNIEKSRFCPSCGAKMDGENK